MEVEEDEEDDEEEDSDEEEEEEEEEVSSSLKCLTRFTKVRVSGRGLPGNRPLSHPGSRRET